MKSNVQARGFLRAVSRRIFPLLLIAFAMSIAVTTRAMAAEYAALVMDARNGKVLHATNADTRLHPASLTKMMTLYITFEAVEHGEIGLDDLVTVSRNAASEPPSKLGLKAGQKIKLRYLIRAAAVKSANDAATAIGEAIEGSEAAFARRMNRTAKALGMSRTTFKNANGLTEAGHLSTARDMTVLGRHLFYDYPEYYNIFSRKTADAGVRTVTHTNSRFLSSYEGADGIKTGYTSAAGFNLTASAHRGNKRIITTVFGGRSTASRNAKVTELMDLGFKRAPNRVAVSKPVKPPYMGKSGGAVMVAGNQEAPKVASKIIRVNISMTSSPLPKARPLKALAPEDEQLLLAASDDVLNALTKAEEEEALLAAAAEAADEASTLLAETARAQQEPMPAVTAAVPAIAPLPRPAVQEQIQLASVEQTAAAMPAAASQAPEVVTRISTSGSRYWGINIGTYGSEYAARKELLRTALTEVEMLDGALRKVVKTKRGYDANFLGLTEEMAAMTCRRLEARGTECETVGPS
ncbi:D-alanyl-D-alanine carboxypeptidase family protein [Celeribacter halophilus]|uniref:D-alanyl-D-alanine carboxypeptidase n=2 Tax=Celeribacter halophilus TaxID=576117 RepID=A0A1I3VHE8_9RHOB|nr:D-alanyl-D-alanine carboxypeptidase family protein [Celeribacter halophilus]PZX09475.1 D-alanyl-D-alanine carboxypeptidase [Celeribacter halophilus]SFJ94844.1 D-alanyl-D-alanine carboxypeptidase [Celeribacter halophilus]